MPYATFADLAAEVDGLTLTLLTDDGNLGEPNQSVCEQMLIKASAVIDAKVSMRYELPLPTPLPSALQCWCIDLAMYYLHGRRGQAPGDVWQSRYDRAAADLDKVATGKMTLGYADPQGAGQRQPVSIEARTAIFSRRERGAYGC